MPEKSRQWEKENKSSLSLSWSQSILKKKILLYLGLFLMKTRESVWNYLKHWIVDRKTLWETDQKYNLDVAMVYFNSTPEMG